MAIQEGTCAERVKRPSPFVSMAVYGLSVIMLKGFSLITIPLYARYLDPAEYGRLDVAVSAVELAGLCASLGLADTLYRFATAGSPDERRRAQAEIFGSGLAGAAIVTLMVQMLVPWIHALFGMSIGEWPLRAGLFAATITGLVELPLAWMRLHDRAFFYLSFVTLRIITQIAVTWALLSNGLGAASILYATFAINIVSCSVFAAIAAKTGGISIGPGGMGRMARYGLPLVGGGLAMYGLGTFDRLFLAHSVTPQHIGHYAIAAKLALATALFIQPLALWWYPKRLTVLDLPDGMERNAKVWNIGFVILIAGAAFTALAMPLFIRFGLPQAYAGALVYLPWLVAASVLNELVSLSSAAAYKRKAGYEVLAVNSAAACIALALYIALIPPFGIFGAIAATLAAHAARLTIIVFRARHIAPVPLLSAPAIIVALTGLIPVMLAQSASGFAALAMLAAAAPVLVGAAALSTKMIKLPRRLRLAAA
jgi:O-antigen/teichoic acid export membrane protein